MIEVVSRQRKRRMDCEHWQAFGEKALSAIRKQAADATIAFVSDRHIRELNKRFRGLDQVTDVLSFPAEEDGFSESGERLGDIAISVQRAESQARRSGLSFEREISQLILHGLLHLCGYDHETDDGEMNKLEIRLRRRLRI